MLMYHRQNVSALNISTCKLDASYYYFNTLVFSVTSQFEFLTFQLLKTHMSAKVESGGHTRSVKVRGLGFGF